MRGPIALLAVTFVAALVSAIPDYSGLPPGPYCGSRPRGCCNGREDQCSFPIIGTLCYCDDFCNRTRSEDCCPDFWSYCKGVEPPPETLKTCLHDGKYLPYKATAKINCNTCKCDNIGDRVEMLCEDHPCMIEPALVESVNREERIVGWQASNYSEFWGRKLDEGLTLRLGTLQPNRSVLRMEPVKRIYDPARLPKTFDSEERWPGQMSWIQDQGWCGSSWAISTAAVASDRYAIMSKGEEQVTLSSQHLLSCNNRGQQSCHGGYLDRAWLFLRKFGVVDEDCYPYAGKEEKCRIPKRSSLISTHCPPPDNLLRKEMYKMSPAYKLGNETDIMFEILENGPVQATMKVYQDFFSYRGGVYKHSTLSAMHRTAYHSVRIVGWGEDTSSRPPKKYWKIANSWGREWGERGYFRMLRGTNECDIEMFVLAAWAKPTDHSANEILGTRSFVNRRRPHRRH